MADNDITDEAEEDDGYIIQLIDSTIDSFADPSDAKILSDVDIFNHVLKKKQEKWREDEFHIIWKKKFVDMVLSTNKWTKFMTLKKDVIYTTKKGGQEYQFRKGNQLDHYRLFAFLMSYERNKEMSNISQKNQRRRKKNQKKIDLSTWRDQFADGRSYEEKRVVELLKVPSGDIVEGSHQS